MVNAPEPQRKTQGPENGLVYKDRLDKLPKSTQRQAWVQIPV